MQQCMNKEMKKMKKFVCIIISVFVCLSFCGCGGEKTDNYTDNYTNGEDSAMGNVVDQNATDESLKSKAATDEFISAVCGKWQRYSGMYYDFTYLELRDDGICLIDDEEYTWDATIKNKDWLYEPEEFVNIYKNGVIVYEVRLGANEEGTPSLTFGSASDEIAPASLFVKV